MADAKITELTELTVPADADLLVMVDDVAGTATTKKITYENLKDEISHTEIKDIGTNTHAQIDTAVTNSANHIADNTQAHSDYLLNSEADTGVGLVLTGDNDSADTQYTAQILYNTDDTPPAASGFPIGTIYIQYTA